MNERVFFKLKQRLKEKLIKGCDNAIKIIKDNTPIDTQRLYESTRIESDDNLNYDLITVYIVAGGIELYGIRREQNIKREVDYVIYVERRESYIRSVLPSIEREIKKEFE